MNKLKLKEQLEELFNNSKHDELITLFEQNEEILSKYEECLFWYIHTLKYTGEFEKIINTYEKYSDITINNQRCVFYYLIACIAVGHE